MADRLKPSITNAMQLECTTLLNRHALVMKGGGVKGLAYVGALRVLQRHYNFDWFVGTSAGAIAAAFLAAGFTVDELEDALKQKNFADFFDSKRRWLPYNLITTGGLYPGIVFKRWVSNRVNEKLQSPAAVKLNHDPNLPGVKLRHRVTIYASTAGQKALAFDSLSPTSAEVDLAYAVRCSMSIPFLFTPQSFNGAVTLDGGIQNNFPVDALLKDHPDTKFVGLYLGPEVNLEQETQPHPILAPLLTQVRALFSIVLDAADRQALLVHRDNTVIINTQPIWNNRLSSLG
jgi:predicted acylesterase/phospholipase RssA